MSNLTVVFFRVLVMSIACGAMYGCDKNTEGEGTVKVNDIEERAAETGSLGETSASNVSKKDLHKTHALAKPGAAVKLKNTEPVYFAAPGVYEHSLVMVSPSYPGKMTVEVSTSEGVDIVSSTRRFEFELQADSEYQLPLALNVSDYGRYYVQMKVTIDTEAASETRVIAAILQVGDAIVKTQKATTTSTAKGGDAIISLPAQETISPR